MLSKDQVLAEAQPHIEGLAKAIEGALTTVRDSYQGRPRSHVLPRTFANQIHDEIGREIALYADKWDANKFRVLPAKKLGYTAVQIGDELIIRFKHLTGRDLRPSNVKTEAQQLLAHQQLKPHVQAALAEDGLMAEPTNVTCGYTRDELELGRVMLRFDNGDDFWISDIFGGEADIEPIPLPVSPNSPIAPAAVRSSRSGEKESEETGS